MLNSGLSGFDPVRASPRAALRRTAAFNNQLNGLLDDLQFANNAACIRQNTSPRVGNVQLGNCQRDPAKVSVERWNSWRSFSTVSCQRCMGRLDLHNLGRQRTSASARPRSPTNDLLKNETQAYIITSRDSAAARELPKKDHNRIGIGIGIDKITQ